MCACIGYALRKANSGIWIPILLLCTILYIHLNFQKSIRKYFIDDKMTKPLFVLSGCFSDSGRERRQVVGIAGFQTQQLCQHLAFLPSWIHFQIFPTFGTPVVHLFFTWERLCEEIYNLQHQLQNVIWKKPQNDLPVEMFDSNEPPSWSCLKVSIQEEHEEVWRFDKINLSPPISGHLQSRSADYLRAFRSQKEAHALIGCPVTHALENLRSPGQNLQKK